MRGRGYLIIGGSAGMGKAAAHALAAEGARVAIAAASYLTGATVNVEGGTDF